jgi:hypothetical protein
MLDQTSSGPAPRPGPRPTPPPAAARIPILRRYARLYERGERKPVLCGREHAARKVIFDSKDNAEAAAVELAAIDGGEPQRAYECELSRSGHYHLTTDLEGE